MNPNILLGIFFLYFVLISGQCTSLLNCSLQRFIKESIWIKHIIIFLSIFIFTFILNWYTFDSIVVGEDFQNEKMISEKQKKLFKNLIYSVFIYIIFIISTKNESMFLTIFLLGSISLVFIYIWIKSSNNQFLIDMQKYNWIGKETEKILLEKYLNDEKDEKDENGEQNNKTKSQIKRNIIIHNSIISLYIFLAIILVVGCYNYYVKQYKDHKDNWSWLTFFFGSNFCRDV